MAAAARKPLASATPTIPLPSADLINFRFDQQDKHNEEISKKLDKLIADGISRAEVMALRDSNDRRLIGMSNDIDIIKGDIDKVKGAMTLLKGVVAILSAAAALIGALWWVKG